MIHFTLLRLGLALGLVFGLAFRNVTAAEKVAEQPSAEECAEFGHWVVEVFDAKEFGELTKRFNALAFARLITKDLGFSDNEILEMSAGVRRTIGGNMEADLKTFEEAHFVRVQEKDGQRRALIRFTRADGAVNYMAFICTRTEGGMTWTDFFTYLTGEPASAASRRLLLPIAAEMKKTMLQKLTSSESAMLKNIPAMQRGLALIRQQKPAEALEVFRKLPAELRKEKSILLLEMRAAQALDEKEYLQTLETIAKAFPNDATMDFVLFDGEIMRKDFPVALRRLASFEKELGGDAHLHFLRANVHIMQEDWAAAKRSARAALADEPTHFSSYDVLIQVSLNEKKYSEVADVLTEIETRFPAMDMHKGIQDDDAYADFRKSPAYTEWTAARAKRAPELLRKPAP